MLNTYSCALVSVKWMAYFLNYNFFLSKKKINPLNASINALAFNQKVL